MRKVYEYRNKAQAELVVVSPSGKTRFKYKFVGGVMDPKNKIHAKYTTDNIIMQQALERSEYFNKVVFLVASFGQATIAETQPVIKRVAQQAPVQTVAAKPAAPATKGKKKGPKTTEEVVENADTDAPIDLDDANEEEQLRVFEDVTTLAEAASVLTSEDGVVATDILTLEGALKVAKEKGISFPNLK